MSRLFASGGQSFGTSASASVLPMNIQGWVSLGLTGLILLSKGLSRVFSTRIRKHQFFGIQPYLWSNYRICTWLLGKNSFDYYGRLLAKWWLCFLICCLFVKAFLPKSKHHLIFCLQSPLTDFGAQENKICHCFHFFSICPEVMGPDAIILVFWMLSFKPAFLLSSLTFIKRLLRSSSLSAIRWYHLPVWGYWYFSQQSWFQPGIRMMYSAYKLNKHGDST